MELHRPETAVDPVCGMTVTIGDDTAHLHHDGTDQYLVLQSRLPATRYAEELGVG